MYGISYLKYEQASKWQICNIGQNDHQHAWDVYNSNKNSWCQWIYSKHNSNYSSNILKRTTISYLLKAYRHPSKKNWIVQHTDTDSENWWKSKIAKFRFVSEHSTVGYTANNDIWHPTKTKKADKNCFYIRKI